MVLTAEGQQTICRDKDARALLTPTMCSECQDGATHPDSWCVSIRLNDTSCSGAQRQHKNCSAKGAIGNRQEILNSWTESQTEDWLLTSPHEFFLGRRLKNPRKIMSKMARSP